MATAFVLKGALMFQLWGGPFTRATKDIDLLGESTRGVDELASIVRDLPRRCREGRWHRFERDSVIAEEIRARAKYDGVRVRFRALIGRALLAMQVDVGFGDVVTPAHQRIEYPSLLDADPPRLLGYTPETAIAEKVHAMVILDTANSRMKDFFDVWVLLQGARSQAMFWRERLRRHLRAARRWCRIQSPLR